MNSTDPPLHSYLFTLEAAPRDVDALTMSRHCTTEKKGTA